MFGRADRRRIDRLVIVQAEVPELDPRPQQPLLDVRPMREHFVEAREVEYDRPNELLRLRVHFGPRDIVVVQHVCIRVAALQFRRGLPLESLCRLPSEITPRLRGVGGVLRHSHRVDRCRQRNLGSSVRRVNSHAASIRARFDTVRIQDQPQLARHAGGNRQRLIGHRRESIVEQ